MSGMSQKQAVVKEVLVHIPSFQLGVDNALNILTTPQLEAIKNTIYGNILTGAIEYGKDVTNVGEVRSYARSMVMNHLKKAKELNGGVKIAKSNTPSPKITQHKVAPKGVNLDLLPEDLKEFAKTLA